MAQNTVNTTNPANQPVGTNPNMQAQAVAQQANGPTNQMAPTARPVDPSSPQFDVKNVKKGVESFMVSFNFATTPITQVADYIITSASKHNASDIHFDPRENGMMVRFRIDGDCQDYTFVPKAYEKNLTTRLKIMANMNITESRLPQDGAIKGNFGDQYLDMRVSSLPLNEGEKIVIRILDYSQSANGLGSLGFSPKNLEKIKRMISVPNGIILITGATGSGKSTTVYTMLQTLNTPETNIITVEDPIEMNIEGINQVQVNAEIGMTFAAALRSILRQDPNIILIGEIRDSETAQIAVRASITGHLVLSTIHTNNALATVERLLDMDVERYLLSTALTGIISQRLAKMLCPDCRYQRETTKYEKKVFKKFMNMDVSQIWDANPKGCEHCRNGYSGRIAVQEVLLINDEIRNAINDEEISREDLKKLVYTKDVTTLLQDGLNKVLAGITSFSEIYKIIEIDNELDDLYDSEIGTQIDKVPEAETLVPEAQVTQQPVQQAPAPAADDFEKTEVLDLNVN
jgi:type IV pilus assembly protein PilB